MRNHLRAPFVWFGGKGNFLGKILPLVPPGGQPYCEPYCGAATVFFARDPAQCEVLNDIDGDIVETFRVFQNRKLFEELRHRLVYTPYARAEFIRALNLAEKEDLDPVTRAWSFIVRTCFSMSGRRKSKPYSWGRAFHSDDNLAASINRWLSRLAILEAIHWRLMMAQIDNRDGLVVIRYWDNPDAVFYIDPPYPLSTRASKNVYAYEMSDDDHRKLVEVLLTVKGSVTLSSYNVPEIHRPLEEAGWVRLDFQTSAHAAGRCRNSGVIGEGSATRKAPRVESVWLNPKAQSLVWDSLVQFREHIANPEVLPRPIEVEDKPSDRRKGKSDPEQSLFSSTPDPDPSP